METVIVPIETSAATCPALRQLVAVRLANADEFVEQHASGTLRKNKRLGMSWRSQYLEERTAYEFGHEFVCLPRSYVTFGDAITEGDVGPITEAGWHIERYLELRPFLEDRLEAKYIQMESAAGKREGIGMILRQTSAAWIPTGHLIFAIVAEFDPKAKVWLSARNPR